MHPWNAGDGLSCLSYAHGLASTTASYDAHTCPTHTFACANGSCWVCAERLVESAMDHFVHELLKNNCEHVEPVWRFRLLVKIHCLFYEITNYNTAQPQARTAHAVRTAAETTSRFSMENSQKSRKGAKNFSASGGGLRRRLRRAPSQIVRLHVAAGGP